MAYFVPKKLPLLSPNGYSAKILQDLFVDGETVCFLQLSFQTFVLSAYDNKIATTLEKILQEDLVHQKTLAESIVLLGGKPIFQNTKGVFLGGRNICDATALQTMLVADIELKEKNIIAYKIANAKIENTVLKKILSSILQDEEFHLQTLKKIVKNIKSPSK